MIYHAFIGIDPGVTGGLCIYSVSMHISVLIPLPRVAQGGHVRSRLDPAPLVRVLTQGVEDLRLATPTSEDTMTRDPLEPKPALVPPSRDEFRILAAIEVPGSRPNQGVATSFSLGHSLGICEGALASLSGQYPLEVLRVPPATWKLALGLNGTGKEGSRQRAKALHPLHHLDFNDHNLAEAALLARFAWLQRERPVARLVKFGENEGPFLPAKRARNRLRGRGYYRGPAVPFAGEQGREVDPFGDRAPPLKTGPKDWKGIPGLDPAAVGPPSLEAMRLAAWKAKRLKAKRKRPTGFGRVRAGYRQKKNPPAKGAGGLELDQAGAFRAPAEPGSEG